MEEVSAEQRLLSNEEIGKQIKSIIREININLDSVIDDINRNILSENFTTLLEFLRYIKEIQKVQYMTKVLDT